VLRDKGAETSPEALRDHCRNKARANNPANSALVVADRRSLRTSKCVVGLEGLEQPIKLLWPTDLVKRVRFQIDRIRILLNERICRGSRNRNSAQEYRGLEKMWLRERNLIRRRRFGVHRSTARQAKSGAFNEL
jgi:hypothetical protein